MSPSLRLLASACLVASLAAGATAHEGHDHAVHSSKELDASSANAGHTTGSGDLKFRYRPDLSQLPPEIASGIVHAHGGFAKLPSGEIYFGLEATGLVRISADLREMTLVSSEGDLLGGGLHNTTYTPRDGGLLVLPDNGRAQVLVVRLDGSPVGKLGRPAVNDHYRATDESGAPKNGYAPTDTAFDADGRLYIVDGYGSKYVLTADLDSMSYGDFNFGGKVPKWERTEGKFSTNHGITLDPSGDSFWIADRELKWSQNLTGTGEFLRGYDMGGANPCDVDFVEFDGETLMVAGCLVGPDGTPGVVHLLREGQIVSTLRPKLDLGIESFQHIHNAVGVVVDGKLYVLCYGWNPGCYAVLEHVAD